MVTLSTIDDRASCLTRCMVEDVRNDGPRPRDVLRTPLKDARAVRLQ